MDYLKRRFISNGVVVSIILTLFYYFLMEYTSFYFFKLPAFPIAIILGFINFISVAFEFKHSNPITRFLMQFSEIVKWGFLMFAFLAVAIWIIDSFIYPIPLLYRRLSLLLIVILFIYGYYNAHKLTITEHTLYIKDLPEEIDLIHLSDIHVGSVRRGNLLKKLVDKINEQDVDLVIISGDLADGTSEIHENDFADFKNCKVPVIFTPGNHDYYLDVEKIIKAAKKADMIVLDNDQTEFKGLNIYGISYDMFGENSIILNIDKDNTNLIIYHVPQQWDKFQELGFDIQLSGHTHGGQFHPGTFFVKLVFPYLRGLYEKNGNYMNVSDGIGTMGPPIRWGTKSEVGILKLRKK